MCGENASIRIKEAGNGHIIETYTPGKRGKHGEHSPGKHEDLVATSGKHVLKLLSKRLLGGRKKGTTKERRTKKAAKQE